MDRDGEFHPFHDYLTSISINHRIIYSHTHHHNATIKRKHHRSLEMILLFPAKPLSPYTETITYLHQFTLQITYPLLQLTLLYHSFFFPRQNLIMDFSRLLDALSCLFLDHIMQTKWIFNLKNVSSLDTQPLTRVTNSYLLLTDFTFLNMLF